jgi:hypothetical protein
LHGVDRAGAMVVRRTPPPARLTTDLLARRQRQPTLQLSGQRDEGRQIF